MRIDPAENNSKNGKYGIPADNPFVNETDPRAVREIYAYGFRNPHRLTWDPTNNNRLMVTDIGEANIEELNIVEKGGDYGWPNREGNFGITTTKDMKTVYKLSTSDLDRLRNRLLNTTIRKAMPSAADLYMKETSRHSKTNMSSVILSTDEYFT